jgi:hypothetical protein
VLCSSLRPYNGLPRELVFAFTNGAAADINKFGLAEACFFENPALAS